VRAKIIDAFKAQAGLRWLEVEHPVFHLIVYPDGSTNQPEPKKKTENGKPVTDVIFDLQANRTEVNNGVLLMNQRALPFNLAANNLSTKVTYRAQPESYLATVHVEDLTAVRGKTPAVHSKLDLNAEIARNALKLDGLHFVSGDRTSGESKLDASGTLNDFTRLHWQIGAKGTVDLRAVAALATVSGAPGRLQLVARHRSGAPVYVDYAHKPEALETVLGTLRPFARGKLVVVFGCGGDRDRAKRPVMGEIATRLADLTLVTDDNPRSEEPAAIRAEIVRGIPADRKNWIEVLDGRHAAIEQGMTALRGKDDLLLIAGKGHETGQTIKGVTHHFDDAEVAREFAEAVT